MFLVSGSYDRYNVYEVIAIINMKICEECGKLYQPRRKDQRFCKGPHSTVCKVCGKSFEYTCIPTEKPNTCSKECRKLYRVKCLQDKYGVRNVSQIPEVREKKKVSNASASSQDKMRKTCLERYGVERANQSPDVRKKISEALKSPEVRDKVRRTFQKHYGADHVFSSKQFRQEHHIDDIPKLESTKQSIRKSLFDKYRVTCISDIPQGKELAKSHRASTVKERYGEDCIFKTQKFKEDMKSRFGFENVIYNPDIRRKAFTNKQKKSSLEIRLKNMLDAYKIEYFQEHVVTEDSLMHSYDFYLPRYKILIDCDGEYWHSYISDPDGDRVRDDYDDVRLYLVPKDHIFHLIVENNFERDLRNLQKMIQKIENNTFDYNTDLFTWCRSIRFPYPTHSKDRMIKDYNSLFKCDVSSYNPYCKLGMSIINNFHKSIYHCSCGKFLSPYDGWNDDELLKKVIANRYIYQNNVDPSKVLQGFNVAKVAPKVSVFNPVLAKHICTKYLSEFSTIVDPFSGFSGRLLGTIASNKQYIGFDIRKEVINESKELINFLNLKNCFVKEQDLLMTSYTDEYFKYGMLTCPPYEDKEIYLQGQYCKSCDEWIDECIKRYKCKRYVFVVDSTIEYKDNVVETIQNSSHFSKAKEYVVVIDGLNENRHDPDNAVNTLK